MGEELFIEDIPLPPPTLSRDGEREPGSIFLRTLDTMSGVMEC